VAPHARIGNGCNLSKCEVAQKAEVEANSPLRSLCLALADAIAAATAKNEKLSD
jgi:hypothetical protein